MMHRQEAFVGMRRRPVASRGLETPIAAVV